jgi:endonuclease V-like protein UPF0215 family
MTHKFVVNTENVNEYGYRVLTNGIDYTQYMRNPVVLFMHTRPDGKRIEAIIGRCIALTVENGELIAEIEFDEKDDFANSIAGKVERGFIRMASMYADVKEASSDATLLLPGQYLETVTKCKLIEISIVDIGGNDDALKLSRGNENKLKKINLKKDDMAKLAVIALTLGLANVETATEEAVAAEVQKVVLAKNNAEAKVVKLEGQLKGILQAEATTIVDKAVQLGLIPDALKPMQLAAFDADHDGQKIVLTKLIAEKEAEDTQNGTHQTLKEVILGKGTGAGKGGIELSFDYLQKHDTVELTRIRDNEPEKYAKLATDYANGKRYTENK